MTTDAQARSPRSTRSDRLILLGIVIVAAVLRGVAAADEPWLDELWSRGLAAHATSAWQIVAGNDFHVDNNHWLNTLYLYALGERAHWYPYRLLSVAGGIGGVALAWPIARRWGRVAACVAAGLTAGSFIFVEYGSEARGYGPAACCGVALLWAGRRFVDGGPGRGAAAVGFNAACVIGFLAHASFVYAFLGAAAYVPFALVRRGHRAHALLPDLAKLFLVPTVFLAWLYVTAIAPMRTGGGPHAPMTRVLGDTFAFTLGLPTGPAALWVGLAATAPCVGYGVYALARRGRDEWAFLFIAGLIAPIVVLLVHRPQPMFPRYLFVALPFLLLLAAAALQELLAAGRAGVAAGTVVLAAFLAGNAVHLRRFAQAGRGENRQTLQYLVAHTAGPDITIAAAQKFRMAIVFDYFSRRTDLRGKTFRYVPPQSVRAPEWFLIDADTGDAPPPDLRLGDHPDHYREAAVFPHYGLSGSDWHVFRRMASGRSELTN